MPRLEVNDALVRGLIWEMAPLVEQATGWRLPLDARRGRALARDQGYEEILQGRLRGIGLDPGPILPRGLLGWLIERMIEENVLAAYQPAAGEILVVRENVDDSNMDGLRLVVAHELVHAAQHRAHPELFRRIDDALREALYPLMSFEDAFDVAPGIVDALEKVRPIMTLMESHAAYVQRALAQARFSGARIESNFNLATLLMRLAGRGKLAQYSEGLPEIDAAHATGTMDALYARAAGHE